MNMDMGDTSMDMSGHDHHNASTDTPMTVAMPSIFISTTTVTLFFNEWTTNSPVTYFLTLFLLFTLAVLNRFLSAWQFQARLSTPSTPTIPILAPPRSRRTRARIPKARLSPLPLYMQVDKEEEDTESGHGDHYLHLRIPEIHTEDEHARLVAEDEVQRTDLWRRVRDALSIVTPNRWTPNAPWSMRVDGGRAMVEGLRAFIGYIL
ncbi:hypothetical protein BJY04DRAFT_179186 [Aspergillus karnatakaensis]|uniref:putative copper transporter crmD n=1 Tax=Aspergillus karnatakaensis TaxID=1810916 RepID=UPI003CCD3BE0